MAIERELEEIKQTQIKNAISPCFFLDVNRATAEEWRKLPGCSENMIELLLKLQKGGVQLSGKEDLTKLLELPENICLALFPMEGFRLLMDIHRH